MKTHEVLAGETSDLFPCMRWNSLSTGVSNKAGFQSSNDAAKSLTGFACGLYLPAAG